MNQAWNYTNFIWFKPERIGLKHDIREVEKKNTGVIFWVIMGYPGVHDSREFEK